MKAHGGRWEHFPHEADVGVRGRGATLAQAFEQAALALSAIVAEPGSVVARDRVEVSCSAPDTELLLVDWLNALIYEMALRKMAFGRFEVRLEGLRLAGVAWGEPIDRARHAIGPEPKGATLTALRVAREDDGWIAQCVIDV